MEFHFVLIRSFVPSAHELRNNRSWWEVTWYFRLTERREMNIWNWAKLRWTCYILFISLTGERDDDQKRSRAANETKQPISPNLNSICPSLLLNDTNSAVLMECNYFNPIKCRLSFWSDAVALRKRHDHVRRHLMRNRSAEDAYAAVLGFKWKVHTNTEGKKNDTKKVSKKWKKNERQERETVEGNKRTYIHA